MAKFKTAKDSIRAQKNKLKRFDRVGASGVNRQDARARAAGEAGAAREAVKRVGEYKRGRVDPADGNNDTINRKSQENLK
ncbi:MAG: hypothetical protein DRQ89_15610 [Epsilonproteobacteria bacterium]|nr:MAG: hypothetical protein DRQ89_15610 [Campylobacterota bacterium]